MERHSLSAVIRGIQHAAASSSQLLAEQYLQLMRQYFHERDDGVLEARTSYVQIDDDHWVPVPLIALVNPRSLSLSRMKVALSLRIEETTAKPALSGDADDADDVDRTSFRVSLAPKSHDGDRRPSDVTDIEMEFTSDDPPEAASRLLEVFGQMVDPNNSHVDRPMNPARATRISGRRGDGAPGGES